MVEISIIVPVYNVEKYIRRCIDRLIAQTFKSIEILLIDDGSTDNSGTICDEYALADDRIKVIHKANGGVSSARNVGLDNAAGTYIMFCDPDDYVEPTWCEKLFDAIESSGGFFACCGYNCVTTSGKLEKAKFLQVDAADAAKTLVELYKKYALSNVWNKIFNLAIIRNNGLHFDETISNAEDTIFTLQYLRLQVCRIGIVSDPIYNYVNDRPQSLTKKIIPNHWALACRVFNEVHMTMQAYGVDFSEYKDAYYSGMILTIMQSFNMLFDYNISNREKSVLGKKILNSDECRAAFKYGKFNDVHPIYKIILQTRCFTLVWLFHWAVKFKHRIVGNKIYAE